MGMYPRWLSLVLRAPMKVLGPLAQGSKGKKKINSLTFNKCLEQYVMTEFKKPADTIVAV
jgi:hypothetical protein